MLYVSGQSSPFEIVDVGGFERGTHRLFCVAWVNESMFRPGNFATRAAICFNQKPGGIVSWTYAIVRAGLSVFTAGHAMFFFNS